jgi:hypothetical protein
LNIHVRASDIYFIFTGRFVFFYFFWPIH